MSADDRSLHAVIADARAGARASVDASPAAPDFADLLCRCRQIDPERTPEASDEVVAGLVATAATDDDASASSPVVDIGAHRAERALDAFVGDAQAALGRVVSDRQRAPIPAGPVPNAPAPRRLVGVFLGAAAAIVIGAIAIGGVSLATRDAADDARDQASRSVSAAQDGKEHGEAVRVSPAPKRPRPARAAPLEEPVPEPSEAEEVVALDPPAPAPSRSKAEQRARRRARWATLADEAQAAWRAGDLAGATKRFETIVSIAGRSRAAELAYNDLFALARMGGDGKRRTALWRAYLKRFPRGRFADDARAGLCRSAAADTRAGCWARYLESFPSGSYRVEAQRAVGK